jgi:hypothetical protein
MSEHDSSTDRVFSEQHMRNLPTCRAVAPQSVASAS